MKLIRKFLEEKRGAGIVEYLLLLCFLGTVTVAVSPTLREQVGVMYDNQVNSTNNLNGMRDSQSSGRYDLEDPGSVVYRPPNVSEENPEENTVTEPAPAPAPVEEEPATKPMTVALKSAKLDFPVDYTYDQEGYYGILQKPEGGLTSEVVDTEIRTVYKQAFKTIQRDTFEEIEVINQMEETDSEGYSGTLTAEGDVRETVVRSEDVSSQMSKPSGDVYITKETHLTDEATIASFFPEPYDYAEVDPATQSPTGYQGNLPKVGEYTRYTIGKKQITDEKTVIQNKIYTQTNDVTSLVAYKEYELVSPTTGTSDTNPYGYPSKYYYNDDSKEGILSYKTKKAVLISESPLTYEYRAVYVGHIFPIQTRDYSIIPASIPYSDAHGYNGTLNQATDTLVEKLSELKSTSVKKNVASHKVYTPGYFLSSTNTQTYPATHEYTSGPNISGIINYVSKGTEVSHTGTETKSVAEFQDSSTNSFPDTMAYNKDGYTGILNKHNASYLESGEYTPSHTKAESTTRHGEYICSWAWDGAKYVPDSNWSETLPDSYTYNQDGYTGTMTMTSTVRKQCDFTTDVGGSPSTYRGTNRVTATIPLTKNYEGNVTKPASDTRVYRQEYRGNVSATGTFYRHYGVYSGDVDEFTRNAIYTYQVDFGGTATFTGEVDYYRYEQLYSGTIYKRTYVEKKVYERDFAGTLFKEEEYDVLEYTQKYTGTVEQR